MSRSFAVENKRDEVMPEGSWEFDAEVAESFDDMLERSIPQYDVMRRAVFEVGSRHQRNGTDIVDLGCSRGGAVDPFLDRFGAMNRYYLCDVSEPMLEAARERYKGFLVGPQTGTEGIMRIKNFDLRTGYPPVHACVTLLVLTLQFTPIEHRQRILRDAFLHCMDGGCLVLVEKVLGATAEMDAMMVDLYLDRKREAGYTEDQIQRKKLSLEGVLVPVTAAWNEELLRMAGFRQVDCFWRWMNFAAWVAVKE
jgi:tRNA (cmo5U34)-methyltransferase